MLCVVIRIGEGVGTGTSVPRRPTFKTRLERSDLVDMGGAQCRRPLRGVREQLAQE